MKGLGGHAAEGRTLFVNATFAGLFIEVNAPAVFAHHGEIGDNFLIVEVVAQIRTIDGVKVAASTTVFNALPGCHRRDGRELSALGTKKNLTIVAPLLGLGVIRGPLYC